MTNLITALIADDAENIFDVPNAQAVGRVGGRFKSDGTVGVTRDVSTTPSFRESFGDRS